MAKLEGIDHIILGHSVLAPSKYKTRYELANNCIGKYAVTYGIIHPKNDMNTIQNQLLRERMLPFYEIMGYTKAEK